MLLCLPKNLVYVFLIVVLGSFAAMSYITLTDKGLKSFIFHSRPSVTETDALYIFLQEHDFMSLDMYKVPEDTEYSLSSFIQNKVSKVRPVKYKGFAKNWRATQEWSIWNGKNLLQTEYGYTQCHYDRLPIANDDSGEFSEYKKDKAKHRTSETKHLSSCIEEILTNPGLPEDHLP